MRPVEPLEDWANNVLATSMALIAAETAIFESHRRQRQWRRGVDVPTPLHQTEGEMECLAFVCGRITLRRSQNPFTGAERSLLRTFALVSAPYHADWSPACRHAYAEIMPELLRVRSAITLEYPNLLAQVQRNLLRQLLGLTDQSTAMLVRTVGDNIISRLQALFQLV